MGSLSKKVLSWNMKKDWVFLPGIIFAFVMLFKDKVDTDTAAFVFLWVAMLTGLSLNRIQRLADVVEELQKKNSK